jgi:two-component system cell cycle sensor histidine kinase/response regulator CckA
MEAIGKLTGGIAHDFNNLLVAVLGYAELLGIELPEDSPFQDYVEQIRLAGDRAAGLVAQLLAFSRKQVLQPRVLDLNLVLRNLEKMLEPLIGEDIRFVSHHHRSPLFVKVDSGQLEQVVVNLTTNARDSMSDQGTLVMETRLVHIDEHCIGEKTNLAQGSYAVLSVADTGKGISAENLARIFDPFFTTKDKEHGTGLGLSTVHGIIKQSGGDIVVRSDVGKGSIFKVYLPITDENPSPEIVSRDGTMSIGRQATETILLVEDEASVSGLVEAVLRREGYLVFVAANGLEALTLVDALDLKPDVLLTDVIMPDMGGPELAKRLAKILPGMKVLYASGYTDSALVNRGALEEGVDLIQKPFVPRALLERLSAMLQENGDHDLS